MNDSRGVKQNGALAVLTEPPAVLWTSEITRDSFDAVESLSQPRIILAWQDKATDAQAGFRRFQEIVPR